MNMFHKQFKTTAVTTSARTTKQDDSFRPCVSVCTEIYVLYMYSTANKIQNITYT